MISLVAPFATCGDVAANWRPRARERHCDGKTNGLERCWTGSPPQVSWASCVDSSWPTALRRAMMSSTTTRGGLEECLPNTGCWVR